MDMTARELRSREAAHEAAARRAEVARVARNAAVRQAIAEGWTHAQIADAMGITRARVGQIALQAT